MQQSSELGAVVKRVLSQGFDVSDFVDGSCTSGYDNDGSTGDEIFGAGVALALRAVGYDRNAQIFWADVDDIRYYQYGSDEGDALARLARELSEAEADAEDAEEGGED